MGFALLLGGVRSGKSRLAIELAAGAASPVTFIATAEGLDAEMRQRIMAHRDERPAAWTTIEEPCDLVGALSIVDPDEFVVVDCLTVWTSNVLLAGVPDDDVLEQATWSAGALAARPGGGVVVSNEVGMGVHPSSELGRRYRDLHGAVNVRFADAAERAGLVVAGRVVPLLDAASWSR